MDSVNNKKITVNDYMTGDVVTVSDTESVESAKSKMGGKRGHSGLPVCDSDGVVVGFVSARDLLIKDGTTVKEVMSSELLVARPKMKLKDASRVILRSGIQRLPVVNNNGKLIGILSSTDVVRSQIERTSSKKVEKIKHTLEKIHNADLSITQGKINIEQVIPTQKRVYGDELEGRKYELQKNLIEPIVVIQYGDNDLIADGHHRVMAGVTVGVGAMDAYVIEINPEEIDLGLYNQSVEQGLQTIDDIEVVDYAQHPLIEKTRPQTTKSNDV